MNLDSLENYCETIGVDVQVVPKGSKLKPPKDKSFNLGLNPDLEKEMELLDYLFHISKSDEDDEDNEDEKALDSGDVTGAWE